MLSECAGLKPQELWWLTVFTRLFWLRLGFIGCVVLRQWEDALLEGVRRHS